MIGIITKLESHEGNPGEIVATVVFVAPPSPSYVHGEDYDHTPETEDQHRQHREEYCAQVRESLAFKSLHLGEITVEQDTD